MLHCKKTDCNQTFNVLDFVSGMSANGHFLHMTTLSATYLTVVGATQFSLNRNKRRS